MTATPIEKAVKAARTRNKTAALRSARLIADGVAQHIVLLEQGAVPESSFMASALKYEQCLVAMRTADTALQAAGTDALANGAIELDREDVAALLETVSAFVPAGVLSALPPLARVAAAVSPEGLPAEEDPAGDA